MSKWLIQSWGGEFLEVEADSISVHEGALTLSRMGHQQVIFADGSWVSAHDDSVVLRNMDAPQELRGVRHLAPVVDINGKEQG